ncbi:MAG: hypothetical protein WCH84_06740 [Verrucomicrobiota bacterium]
MKTAGLFLVLLLAGSILTAGEPPAVSANLTNAPAAGGFEMVEAKVLKVYSAKDGNAEFRAYAVLWKGQEIVVSDTLAGSNFCEGDTVKFMAMKHHFPSKSKVYDLLRFEILPERKTLVRIAHPNKQPVFFECRSNEVFFVDKAGIATLTPNVRAGDPASFVKVIQSKEIGNEFYKVIPSYLMAWVIALEPRTGVPGENLEQLEKADSKFQTLLAHLDQKTHYLVFMVRNDSSKACLLARAVAENRGFETTLTPLKDNEPIKFGTGGQQALPTGVPTGVLGN